MTAPRPDRTRDAGLQAHRAAVTHLDACQEALFAEEDAEPDIDSPAIGPYCGCTDCDIRETLAAAWPILLDDAAALVEHAGHRAAAQLLRNETSRVQQVLAASHRTTG